MSYKNSTTHFQWPLPEETDLFNGLDDNQMKEDLDEKIYNLEQRSTGDHEAVTELNTRVTKVEQTVGGYDEQLEKLEGTVGEHAERLVLLTNRQTQLSRRLDTKAEESTIAPAYNEEESYAVGDLVYHSNILYEANQAIAQPAGDFDSSKWDIATISGKLGTPEPEFTEFSVTGDGVKTRAQILTELKASMVAAGKSLKSTSYMLVGQGAILCPRVGSYSFMSFLIDSTGATISNLDINAGSYIVVDLLTNTKQDSSSTVVANGSVWKLFV